MGELCLIILLKKLIFKSLFMMMRCIQLVIKRNLSQTELHPKNWTQFLGCSSQM